MMTAFRAASWAEPAAFTAETCVVPAPFTAEICEEPAALMEEMAEAEMLEAVASAMVVRLRAELRILPSSACTSPSREMVSFSAVRTAFSSWSTFWPGRGVVGLVVWKFVKLYCREYGEGGWLMSEDVGRNLRS